ncbi:Androgen-dependent TFPI-regulating protein [Nibea albiflora]|uniref:Androgen-dependent TFPI-regulating protein n=1 Tax=Nibea albiflora TaxID=240163 RepID=A0ACB7ECY3_NIBAL|nr:Androgen-dependent TFPI-regulating protein [Nibea albiflora]
MALTLRRVYHITAFSWYAFIVKSLAAKDGEELPPGIFVYGGPWKYLTFLNVHTFVFPVLLGEVLVQPHIYPQIKHALAALGVVGLSYLSWIIWVYLSVGIWVYPLLGHFSTTGLVGFFFFNMTVVTLLYVLGDKLNTHIWSKRYYVYHWRQTIDYISIASNIFLCLSTSVSAYVCLFLSISLSVFSPLGKDMNKWTAAAK